MSYKEDLERIAAQQKNRVSPEELVNKNQSLERYRAVIRADKLLARLNRDITSMNTMIEESKILELLQQAGQILHKRQETRVSFYYKEINRSQTLIPERNIVEGIFRDWIIEGKTLSAEVHHADIRLVLDYESVITSGASAQMGGPGGEDGPSYTDVPIGIGFYMDRNGSFYRQGALNFFNRIATRAQWQRSSDPLERAIKNDLNVYFQQHR